MSQMFIILLLMAYNTSLCLKSGNEHKISKKQLSFTESTNMHYALFPQDLKEGEGGVLLYTIPILPLSCCCTYLHRKLKNVVRGSSGRWTTSVQRSGTSSASLSTPLSLRRSSRGSLSLPLPTSPMVPSVVRWSCPPTLQRPRSLSMELSLSLILGLPNRRWDHYLLVYH